MSNDDDRPRRQTEQPPTDSPRRCEPGNPWSEPVYVSVLEAFRPLPGQHESIGRLTSGPSCPAPGKAKARVRTRRFMANGRQLRLLPGGWQSDSASGADQARADQARADQAGADQAGADQTGPASRPDQADETAQPDQGIQADLTGQADLAARFGGLGPAAGLTGQAPAARYRLQLLRPPENGDASREAPHRSGGKAYRSDNQNAPEHSRPRQRDRPDPGQPGTRDAYPGRHDQPGPSLRLGQPARRTSHYLASTWEYAGARALAAAGRHRHHEHAEPQRSARTALTWVNRALYGRRSTFRPPGT
jgi:hypothetical protein